MGRVQETVWWIFPKKNRKEEFLSFRVAQNCSDVLDYLSIVQWGLYVTRHANVITWDRLFRRNNKGFVHLDHQEIILGPKMLEYKYFFVGINPGGRYKTQMYPNMLTVVRTNDVKGNN